jgi:hypothetical protein
MEELFIDCKEVIADYWNFRSSTYKNGSKWFDEDERTVWKTKFLKNPCFPGKR